MGAFRWGRTSGLVRLGVVEQSFGAVRRRSCRCAVVITRVLRGRCARSRWLSGTLVAVIPVLSVTAIALAAGAPGPSARATGNTSRIVLTAPAHAITGRGITLRIRDTERLGGLAYLLCVHPPAFPPACEQRPLAKGQISEQLHVPLASPGIWRFWIKGEPAQGSRRAVRVAHPNGKLRLLATGDPEILDTDPGGFS